jgi:hypothetical protein
LNIRAIRAIRGFHRCFQAYEVHDQTSRPGIPHQIEHPDNVGMGEMPRPGRLRPQENLASTVEARRDNELERDVLIQM